MKCVFRDSVQLIDRYYLEHYTAVLLMTCRNVSCSQLNSEF